MRCCATRRSAHRRSCAPARRAGPGGRTAGTLRLRLRRRRSGTARDQPQRERSPQTASHGAAAGPQHAPHLAQRRSRIGHVHETERAQRDVEAGVGQLERLGIHAREVGVAHAPVARAPARAVDHPRGQIDADDLAIRRRRPRPPPTTRGPYRRRRRARARPAPARRVASTRAVRGRELRLPQRLVVRGGQVPAVALEAPLQPRLHAQRAGDDDFEVLARHDQRTRAGAVRAVRAARSGRARASPPCRPAARANALCTGPYQVRKTSMKCAAER